MEGLIVTLKGIANVWIFGAGYLVGYLVGCLSMELVRRSITRRAMGDAKAAAGVRHVTLIENTRRDDGARLLGEIEDELHLYGIGSDTRPEIHHPEGA